MPKGKVIEKFESVEETLRYHNRIVLLGPPGSGKTTTLKCLVYRNSKKIKDGKGHLIPLYVDLSSWPDSVVDLRSLINLEKNENGLRNINNNNIFYLIDCIDKISEERISLVNDWINQNTDKKLIISGRSSSFFRNCKNNLSEVVIKKLNNDRIKEFIKKYVVINKELAIEQILELDLEKKKLKDLVKNPFILSFLCFLFTAKRKLPDLKGTVVRDTVKAIFYRYNRETNNKFAYDRILNALGKLSLELFQKGSNNSANLDFVINIFSEFGFSKSVIDFLSLIDFIEINEKRTSLKIKQIILQEYFAAEYIYLNKCDIEKLVKKPFFFAGRRKPQPFDNVISLLFDIEDKKITLNSLLKKDPFLLYNIIQENNIVMDYLDNFKLIKEIIPSLFTDNYNEYQCTLKILVELNECTDLIENYINTGPHWQKRRSLQLLGQIRNEKAAKLICESLNDSNRWVRKDAAKILRFADAKLSKYVNSYISNELIFKDKDLMYSIGIPLIKCFEIRDEPIKEKLSNNFVLFKVNENYIVEQNIPNMLDDLRFVNIDGELDSEEETELDLYEYLYTKGGYYNTLRKSLITTPYDDNLWFKKWNILLSLQQDDLELIQLGLEWLKYINDTHPLWTIVWCKIWKFNIYKQELYELGYNWVFSKYLMHKGWSYVWFELFQANLNDKKLTELGIEWIKNREYDNDFYGFIWFSIWQVSNDRSELNQLGLMLLKTISPQKISWGFILPRLYKENIFKKELEILGQYWLKTAETSHKGWGYIWPLFWKNSKGDEELYIIGYKWLNNAPVSHGAWGYIWNELFVYNTEDKELLRIGLEWIENAPRQHGAWSIIWNLLFDSKYKNEELKIHGLNWLQETNIEHKGWPFLWTRLLHENYEKKTLFDIGINWIKNISYENEGWGSVFPELTSCCYNIEIEDIGKKWLKNVGFRHESWSFIWESIYVNTQNKKDLHKIGQKWLMEVNQNDPKWYYIWRYFFDEFKNENAFHIFTIQWLDDNYLNPSWIKVWKTMWENDTDNFELLSLLKRNLRCSNCESYSIYSLWNEIKYYFKEQPEYLSIAIELLNNKNISNFYWLDVFSLISKNFTLPEDISKLKDNRELYYLNDDYEKKYFEETFSKEKIKNTFNSNKTGIKIQNMLHICKNKDYIMPFIFEWLDSDTKSTKAWPFVWKNSFRHAKNKQQYFSIGYKWINTHSSTTPGWALVWLKIIKMKSEDKTLLQKGWEWMNTFYEKRSSWPKVWSVLCEFENKENEKLNDIGLNWIIIQREDRENASLVWLKLWENENNRKIILPWGIKFVNQNKTHERWVDLFLALWSQISTRDKLRPILKKYHVYHRDHENYNYIKEILNYI